MSTPTPAPAPPLRNSYWVIPGKVLAGEHPTAATVEATRERLQRLMDAGVECFIDLTEPGEIKPYDTEIPFSIEYLRKPIKDHGIPSQRAHMAEILDCIHDALQSGRCVYVHCRAGIGRTGTVIGCLLVERGFEGEGAIDELNLLWQQSERSQNWPSVPETDDQAGYVRKWKARAVFAEELSLASAAARNLLAGKSGSPAAPAAGAGSTAGANANLGRGQAPAGAGPDGVLSGAGRAAPDVGLPAGRGGGGSDAGWPLGRGSVPAPPSSGAPADPVLSRLGLPLLDDDDDESSDFATFNRARGIPPAPVANPGDWPSFGKQPTAGLSTAAPTGQGTPTNKAAPPRDARSSTRETSKTSVSPRGSAPADPAARDSAKRDVAVRDSAAADYAAHNAAKAGASTRGSTPADPAARDSAKRSVAASDSLTTDATAPGLATHGSAGAASAANIAIHSAPNAGASTRDSVTTDPAARSLSTPGVATDSAATNIATHGAPNLGASARDSAITDPTGRGFATHGAPADSAAADATARGPSARGSAGDSAATNIATRGAPNAGVSTRDSATTDPAARSLSTPSVAADSAAANIATRGAPNAGAATRDSAPSDATGRGSSTRGSAGDPASDIVARAPAHPGAPNVLTSNISPDDDPLADPGALSAARGLRDRFLGALLGLAAGDAVSAATQFRKPGTFTPVGDMIGGGPFDLPRGGWSDDTAMALCLADSLLERDGFDARDQMERYRKWQQEGYLTATGQCVGITASTARAIAMSAWRRGALFGSHDPAQLDPEPLSRVAPAVMFFFAASGQAVEQATEAARTTCQAPAVLDACRCLARAMHAALAGQPKAVVLEKAAQAIGPGLTVTGPGRTATGISASAALTAAVAAFGATANFRDAVLYAANLGGDSDVISAVCGQLAGAYYSVKAIPTSWHNGLMHKDLIISYADRLLAHALLGLSG